MSYETRGYDFLRGETQVWFASWGDKKHGTWTVRDDVGRPPTDAELRDAHQVVLALRKPDGSIYYRSFLPREHGAI